MVAPDAWESHGELHRAALAAERLISMMQSLADRQQSIPQLLVGTRPVHLWSHYPDGDACDFRHGYRYYYHAHRSGHAHRFDPAHRSGAHRARTDGMRADGSLRRSAVEHGHFHLFAQVHSSATAAHLLAIAVDARGRPLRLFTTNRWVTGEEPQPAARVLAQLRGFRMRTPALLRPVHEWLRALLQLFAPQIRDLLYARDARLQRSRAALADDRRVAILSARRIRLERQVTSIHHLLQADHHKRGDR